MKKNISMKFKIFFLIIFVSLITLITSGCDKTLINISTQINSDYSGVRIIDIAVKTEYIKKGEITFGGDKSLSNKILDLLPQGEINTSEKDNYTHFTSTINFKDINFLQHVSIDNFSNDSSERFYAKIEKKDYFFYTQYFFTDYIDMKIDDDVIKSGGSSSDFARLDSLFKSDKDIINISYQVKFPFKIIKSNSDNLLNNNTAIWNLNYGDQKLINVEGKKIKFLPYFLIIILGFIVLFILFLIFAIIFSSTKRKIDIRKNKPIYSYDNYFKKNKKY
jgi:hypothetical protein